VAPENIHIPLREGFFQFDPLSSMIFHSRELHSTPPPPGISMTFT